MTNEQWLEQKMIDYEKDPHFTYVKSIQSSLENLMEFYNSNKTIEDYSKLQISHKRNQLFLEKIGMIN